MNLDQETLSFLDDKEKQELEIWDELLQHRGFQQLKLLFEEEMRHIQQILENAASWDQYQQAQGGKYMASFVLHLQERLEYRMEQIGQERAELERQRNLQEESVEINLDAGAF